MKEELNLDKDTIDDLIKVAFNKGKQKVKEELEELQEAYDNALKENNRLRKLLEKKEWKKIS